MLLGCVAEWHREVHGRWHPFQIGLPTIEVGYDAWLNGGDAKYAVANAPFEPNPVVFPPTLAQRHALKSAETQRQLAILQPFERSCCCCLCRQNAVTDTVMEVDFARGIAVDTQTGGCGKCMKTKRSIKRLFQIVMYVLSCRFQSLRARDLLPASGQRLHAIQEGSRVVIGERAHHGMKKRGRCGGVSTTRGDIQRRLVLAPRQATRTKTDFTHGRDPVWEPHTTPVLHTRLNHLESLGTDSHSPHGLISLTCRAQLNNSEGPGLARCRKIPIGTATITVRQAAKWPRSYRT